MALPPAESVRATPKNSTQHARVWAAVICYRTTAGQLAPLIRSLESQVERVLLLDNSPEVAGALEPLVGIKTTHVPMPGNLGTAGAMNVGWERAVEAGADYMITFDQDSQAAAHLAEGLLDALLAAQSTGLKVAAVGPRKIDPRTGRPMRVLRPVHLVKRYAPADAQSPVVVDHLITSGCLMTREAFLDVGPYRTDLFLDYVDIEWCLRARALGYALLCVPACTMPHVIGDAVVRVGSRSVWVHAPARNGLLVRNHVRLWRVPTVPRTWLLNDAVFVAAKLAVQCLSGPQRLERLRHIARGIRDGFTGRDGASA